jgi:hypothetical protein
MFFSFLGEGICTFFDGARKRGPAYLLIPATAVDGFGVCHEDLRIIPVVLDRLRGSDEYGIFATSYGLDETLIHNLLANCFGRL